MVVADRADHEHELGVQPVVARPLADAVAEPEDEAEAIATTISSPVKR